MPTYADIEDRLLQRFATLHTGTQEPPVAVRTIASVLAKELQHIRVEQQQAEHRILNSFQNKVQGKFGNRQKPLAKIVQVPSEIITAKKQTSFTHEEHIIITNEHGRQRYFSPLYPIQLHDVQIKYRYWNGQLLEQKSANEIRPMPNPNSIPPTPRNELLLGIRVAEKNLPEHIFLHLAAQNGLNRHDFSRVMPHIRVETNEKVFPTEVCPLGDKLPSEELNDWRERQWMLREIEAPFAAECAHSFLKINGFNYLPDTTVEAVLQRFVQDLQGETLYWLKLIFPTEISQEEFAEMTIGFNCFPMLNRRLVTREEKPTDLEKMPLFSFPLRPPDNEQINGIREHFLGLQKVFYGSGQVFQPAIVSHFRDVKAGEYGLQQGSILAFHEAEAKRQFAYLMTLFETEQAVLQNAFAQRLSRGDTRNKLEEIRKELDALHQELPSEFAKTEQWFLYCKPVSEEHVLVRFWMGQ